MSYWQYRDGPWIDYRKPMWKFIAEGLAKPGTTVNLESSGAMLIGHMNPEGGYCNCCNNDHEIVLQYSILEEVLEDTENH